MNKQQLLETLGQQKRDTLNSLTILETMESAWYTAMKKRHGRKVNFLYRGELIDTPELCKLHAARHSAVAAYQRTYDLYRNTQLNYRDLFGQDACFNLIVYGREQ